MKWQIKAPHQITLLNCYLVHQAMDEDLKKATGFGFRNRFAVFKNQEATGYSLLAETEEFVSQVRKAVLKSGDFVKKNVGDYYLIEKKYKKFLKGFGKLDLKKQSNKKLLEIFEQFAEIYCQFLIYGPLTGRVMSKAASIPAKDYLIKKIGQGKNQAEAADLAEQYLVKLILPNKVTFQSKHEKDLLVIALKFSYLKNKLLKIKIGNSWAITKSKIVILEPKFAQALESLTKKYCWLPVFQEGNPWDEIYFLQAIVNLMKQGNIRNKLKEYKTKKAALQKKQKQLLKQLSLSPPAKRLIKTLEAYSYLRTRFGNFMGYINHYIQPLYQEMAKRVGLNTLDFKYLMSEEIHQAFLNKKLPKTNELRSREKFSVLVLQDKKQYVLLGNKAKDFLAKELKDEVDKNVVEFKGRTAYMGKAKGRVKVILTPKTMAKMNKGDILVTPMTSTDLIMAIKKAAAIVTDIGGLTSHAAIISREFSIPCIIDTKVATQVLKDGDLVEVDATTGIVKIIK